MDTNTQILMTEPWSPTVKSKRSYLLSAVRPTIIFMVMTTALACTKPNVVPKTTTEAPQTTSEAASTQVAPAVSRQVNAPLEQLPEADKALAFLGHFEAAVKAKSYDQIAALISADFVQFETGKPVPKKAIKFIDSLLCGYNATKPISLSSMHCFELRQVKTLSLQALHFYGQDAWQLTYTMSGSGPQTPKTGLRLTIKIELSLTKEDVPGQGKVFRLMGPAG